MMSQTNTLRLCTLVVLFCFLAFNNWPPPAPAQNLSADDRLREVATATASELAVHDKELRDIEIHLTQTDERVQRQWVAISASQSGIAVINAGIDQTKWWIVLIVMMTAGQFVWTIKKSRDKPGS